MTLLKFVDGTSQKSIGAFNWFATHGTSMSKDNTLISGDNKGAAARFFEDWFTSTATNSTTFDAQGKSNHWIELFLGFWVTDVILLNKEQMISMSWGRKQQP